MELENMVLEGRFVRLEPLTPELERPLCAAIGDHAPDWELMATTACGEAFEAWWMSAISEMAQGRRIAYAVRRLSDGRVVGATSFTEMHPGHRRVEIGSTFLHPDVRSGPANPDMKRTMMAYAFDRGAVRVELVTDLRNTRSQAAIAKLGATREGVLRRHKITWTGHVRDTVIYAVTDLDWPDVRTRLDARLAEAAAQAARTTDPTTR